MAKKRRSAAQRAATKKLVALNRKRAKPKRRRRAIVKVVRKGKKRARAIIKRIKRRSGSKSMVGIPKIPPVVKKVATGIGLASIGVTLLNFVSPSLAQNQIVKPALAFIGGGIPAAIVQFLLQGGTSLLGGGAANGASRGGAA